MRNRLDSTSDSRLVADQEDICEGASQHVELGHCMVGNPGRGGEEGDGAAYSLLTELGRVVLYLINQLVYKISSLRVGIAMLHSHIHC
jgi:hypothetical protein